MTIAIKKTETPVYASVTDVQAATSNKDLQTLLAAETTKLIIRAEQLIDFLVGFHKKYYSQFSETDDEFQEQRTIFPRIQDYDEEDDVKTPFIPYSIFQATVLLAEIFYERDAADEGLAELDALLGGADSAKLGDFAITKKSKSTEAVDYRESIGDYLSESPKGKRVLAYTDEFKVLTFRTR